MTKLEHLIALRDAVKAGDIDQADMVSRGMCSAARDVGHYENLSPLSIEKIILRGSLDAALALHNAVLPGWAWKRVVHPGPIASVGVWSPPRFVWGHTALEADGNTARAWLIAILEAMIAMEEGK